MQKKIETKSITKDLIQCCVETLHLIVGLESLAHMWYAIIDTYIIYKQ